MWVETLASALISTGGGLSVVHIALGLIMIVIAVGLGWHLTSAIKNDEHKRTAQIDAAVFEYTVSHVGEVNVTQCAKTLKLTQEQVMEAIRRLQKAKRVAVEEGRVGG